MNICRPSGHQGLVSSLLRIRTILALCLVIVTTACVTRPHGQTVPTPPLKRALVAISPGDELDIQVFREKELSKIYQVSDAGTIDFPLVGRVKAAGLQPPQLAKILQTRLADGYLRRPYVSVFAKGYRSKRSVYVWGQVRKSGVFEYVADMPLIKAIALAGGLTPMANRNGIVVTRVEEGKRKTLATPMGEGQSATYQLKPGDVVFVPERVF